MINEKIIHLLFHSDLNFLYVCVMGKNYYLSEKLSFFVVISHNFKNKLTSCRNAGGFFMIHIPGCMSLYLHNKKTRCSISQAVPPTTEDGRQRYLIKPHCQYRKGGTKGKSTAFYGSIPAHSLSSSFIRNTISKKIAVFI